MYLREGLRIDDNGGLIIGGCTAAELAKEYGTPLYVMDEAYIRSMCKKFTGSVKKYKGESMVCFASKAFSCKEIYRIMKSEGLGADVVSGGELYTALAAGMDADKIYMHGNNKTRRELLAALEGGVHAIVLDGFSEIEFLNEIAKEKGCKAKSVNVLIRVNPGIDAHTHEYVQTARTDSKFGIALTETVKAVGAALSSPALNFLGFHTHIGSQIFELEPYAGAVETFCRLASEVEKAHNIRVKEFNFGGGWGIRYTEGDNPPEIETAAGFLIDKLEACLKKYNITERPRLVLEPGRSLVAEAGITLYTVGVVKTIKLDDGTVKKYVSVDGGMFENPRYCLYKSRYSAIPVSNANAPATDTVTIAGKCCETGDMLAADIPLAPVKRGDVIAVLSTGAYNYSMASNYNRNAVPPVVMVNNGKARYIVKPQTDEDIARRDV